MRFAWCRVLTLLWDGGTIFAFTPLTSRLQISLANWEEAVGLSPADRAIFIGEPDLFPSKRPSDPFQKNPLRAGHQDWRAPQSKQRPDRPSPVEFRVEPVGPFRYHRQPEPLRDAIQHKRRIVVA